MSHPGAENKQQSSQKDATLEKRKEGKKYKSWMNNKQFLPPPPTPIHT